MTEENKSFFSRFRDGLKKSRESIGEKIRAVLPGSSPIDEETLDELEEVLVSADIGVDLADELIGSIKKKTKGKKEITTDETITMLKEQLLERFLKVDRGLVEAESPRVILFVGINGSGKTTTIGKLIRRFSDEGKRVLVGAGDTFRAAAIEQLNVWAERSGAEVVRHGEGSDPSAVAFDAVSAAKSRGCDIVLLDTAGRLHAKSNLMEELKKIHRVINKALPGAPHETLLVLDGTSGQNAIAQAEAFHKAIGITGIVITKLDGTAKGGAIVPIERRLGIPVKLVGLGEKAEDLVPFSPENFVDALF